MGSLQWKGERDSKVKCEHAVRGKDGHPTYHLHTLLTLGVLPSSKPWLLSLHWTVPLRLPSQTSSGHRQVSLETSGSCLLWNGPQSSLDWFRHC
jgi:hypothetical protein